MKQIGPSLPQNEARIARARQRASELGERLKATPIDRRLYGELQNFLDGEAFPACDAMETLSQLPVRVQRQRLNTLLGVAAEEVS